MNNILNIFKYITKKYFIKEKYDNGFKKLRVKIKNEFYKNEKIKD